MPVDAVALTAAGLTARGFKPPQDAAVDHHYRRRLAGDRTVEAFLPNSGPRVMVFRGKRWFEAVVATEAQLDTLLAVLDG